MSIQSEITRINSEVSEQENLINQIKTALEGKAAGGGGGVTNEICEVTVEGSSSSYYPKNIAYTSVDNNGKVIGVSQSVSTSSVTITCVKGSTLAVEYKSTYKMTACTNAIILFYTSTTAVFKLDDNATTAKVLNSSMQSGGND